MAKDKSQSELLPVSKEAKAATAKALGYKDWGDATDYRLSGAQDRQVAKIAQIFARFERDTIARHRLSESRCKISPQIRFAVERALERARKQLEIERKDQESLGCVTLQGVAWADEVESLECAVDVLEGLE